MSPGETENIRISKFLSLVLRHKPQIIGLELDKNGWAEVSALLQKMHAIGFKLSQTDLEHLVNTNNKKRFRFDENKTRIRASQGHSIIVELNYQPQNPPPVLYHGTATRFIDAIMANGLQKQNRHHVHLSDNVETARQVGQRHGKPIVLQILAGEMFAANYKFYLSDNGVWLTEYVPPAFLQLAPAIAQ